MMRPIYYLAAAILLIFWVTISKNANLLLFARFYSVFIKVPLTFINFLKIQSVVSLLSLLFSFLTEARWLVLKLQELGLSQTEIIFT